MAKQNASDGQLAVLRRRDGLAFLALVVDAEARTVKFFDDAREVASANLDRLPSDCATGELEVGDLGLELGKLSLLDEGLDTVVRVEALAAGAQALADPIGHGRDGPGTGPLLAGFGFDLSGHGAE